jgi:hypothetical protein
MNFRLIALACVCLGWASMAHAAPRFDPAPPGLGINPLLVKVQSAREVARRGCRRNGGTLVRIDDVRNGKVFYTCRTPKSRAQIRRDALRQAQRACRKRGQSFVSLDRVSGGQIYYTCRRR